MLDAKLQLLSDSLRAVLIELDKAGSVIAKELRTADALITIYNSYLYCDMTDNIIDYNDAAKEIEKSIEKLITDEARMLSYRINEFSISYLPKGKKPVYTTNNNWGRENRQQAKPARIIQKLLVNKYSCKEMEDFSNKLKAAFIDAGTFELVQGKDIVKYYNEKTYFKDSGTLANSCMRYDECEKYFTIYKDLAQMLICKKDDKIKGRAIVWTIDGKTYLDRVYTTDDFIVDQFLDYAKDHKWYIREYNSLLYDDETMKWFGPEDNYEECLDKILTIHLPKRYRKLPYMDTFRYYDSESNTMSTEAGFGDTYLSNTDGTYKPCSSVFCAQCGAEDRFRDDEDTAFNWSDRDECYYCDNCGIYCDLISDWVGINCEISDVVTGANRRLHTFITSRIPTSELKNFSHVKIGDRIFSAETIGTLIINNRGRYEILPQYENYD